jgi:hypothetical protein
MLNTNVPDRFNDKLAEINKTVKAGTKEFDLQTEALNRTEAAWKKHLKRIDDSVARRASIEATIVKWKMTVQMVLLLIILLLLIYRERPQN